MEERCGLADGSLDLHPWSPRYPEPERQILGDRHPWVESVGLEHHGDAALAWFLERYVVPGDDNFAVIGLDQAGDGIEQRGFAAPGGAEQDDEFTLRNV